MKNICYDLVIYNSKKKALPVPGYSARKPRLTQALWERYFADHVFFFGRFDDYLS